MLRESDGAPPWEQYFMQQELARMSFAGVRLCDRYEIGGFCHELRDDGEPWVLGCPAVRFAGQGWTWEQRQKVFVESYLPQVKR